jgi:hypothetical protein
MEQLPAEGIAKFIHGRSLAASTEACASFMILYGYTVLTMPQITIHRGRLQLFHLHVRWAACEPRSKNAFLPSCKRNVHPELAETQTRAMLLSPHASALRYAPLSTWTDGA